jgi:hypothetical protein
VGSWRTISDSAADLAALQSEAIIQRAFSLALQGMCDRGIFMAKILASVLGIGWICWRIAAAQVVVLFDDFEGGAGLWQTNGWGLSQQVSVSPTHAFTESPSGNYPGNAVLTATTVVGANLTGYSGARLQFWAYYEIELGFDFCFIEATRDGNFWVPLGSLTGLHPAWELLTYDLGGFAGLPNVRIRFRFVSDPQTSYDGMYLDDFTVIGLPSDSSGPLILHRGPIAYEGSPFNRSVYADFWDVSGIFEEHLYFRTDGTPFQEAPRDSVVGERYYHTIPAQEAGTLVEYYFTARDASPLMNESFSDTFAYLAGRMLIQDDGVSEGLFEAAPGNRAAVRFQMHNAGYIASALLRFYTDSTHPLDSAAAYVWADSLGYPGEILGGPFPLYPASTPENPEAWTWVDLRSGLIPAPDTFHVGLQFALTGSVPSLTLTYDSPPVYLRSAYDVGSGWESAVFGDFHIRAVVGQFTPDELDPPTNLAGAPQGDLLLLTWSAPAEMDALLRYEIERQSVIIGQTEHLETNYTDTLTNLPEGYYTYRVRARYSTGVSAFSAPYEYHWVPVGIRENVRKEGESSDAAVVFPNPVNGMIRIGLKTFRGAQSVELKLYDVRGCAAAEWREALQAGQHQLQLQLPNDLPAAVYVLVVDLGDGSPPLHWKVIYLP